MRGTEIHFSGNQGVLVKIPKFAHKIKPHPEKRKKKKKIPGRCEVLDPERHLSLLQDFHLQKFIAKSLPKGLIPKWNFQASYNSSINHVFCLPWGKLVPNELCCHRLSVLCPALSQPLSLGQVKKKKKKTAHTCECQAF